MKKRLDNFKNDLVKSMKKPLALELKKNDLNALGKDGLKDIYNFTELLYGKPNIMHINSYSGFLKNLFEYVEEGILNKNSFPEIDKKIKSSIDYFIDYLKKEKYFDKYIDLGISQFSSILNSSITHSLIKYYDDILNDHNTHKFIIDTEKKILENNDIKNYIFQIINNLNHEKDLLKILSLTVTLFCALTIKSKKVLIIDNPNQLDGFSVIFLSLIVSYIKEMKEKGKHIGITLIYIYSDDNFQPNNMMLTGGKNSIKGLLHFKRIFLQRNSMLERPTRDIPKLKYQLKSHYSASTYIIGDVHGCYHTLVRLISKINKRANIIFVGDLCDRGLFTKQVIDYIIKNDYQVVMGNHDEYMIKHATEAYNGIGSRWIDVDYMGGKETLVSYRNDFDTLQKHISWLKTLPTYLTIGKYFITHSFSLPYFKRKDEIRSHIGLLKIRMKHEKDFGHEWEKDWEKYNVVNIFGHSHQEEVLFHNQYINIDTGCVYGGKLTALELGTNKVIQEKLDIRDIKYL